MGELQGTGSWNKKSILVEKLVKFEKSEIY